MVMSGKQGLWGRNDPTKSDNAASAVPYIAYSYDPAGLITGKTLGNGVEYAALFDAVNRQVTCTWETGNQTLAGYNYAYDDASNRKYEKKIHDPNNSQLYKYDTVYQVDKFKAGLLNHPKTNIPRPDRSQDWTYDPMGNWRRFIDSEDGRQQRRHNEVNEITQITEFGEGPRRPRRPVRTALSYDANGNLLDDGEYLYAWDAFNRLVEVRLKRNSRIVGQYFYDAMHRRTKRLANLDYNASLETQVTYIYDAFNCISEISNLQSVITTKSYVWGNDISGAPQSAGGVGGLVAVFASGPQPSAFYPLFDARGNITAYTGSTGSITATFDYLPFGALVNSTGNADAFSYRFSTKPFDPETGLVYYNFRYYSPELGRWMSRDLIGEHGGINLYGMVGNNAIKNIDLFGLDWCENELIKRDIVKWISTGLTGAREELALPGLEFIKIFGLGCYPGIKLDPTLVFNVLPTILQGISIREERKYEMYQRLCWKCPYMQRGCPYYIDYWIATSEVRYIDVKIIYLRTGDEFITEETLFSGKPI